MKKRCSEKQNLGLAGLDIVEPFWATLAELTRVGFKHSAVTGQGIEHTIEANVVVVVDLEEAPDRLQIAKAVEVREVSVIFDGEVAPDRHQVAKARDGLEGVIGDVDEALSGLQIAKARNGLEGVIGDGEEAPDRHQVAKAREVREVGVILDDEVAPDRHQVVKAID